jgi:hypothetical protein
MLARLGLLALAATSAPAGCFGDKDALHPGTDLGTFQVQGALSTNTCGDGALGEQATWDFSVRLARDPGVLYWDNGQAVIGGTLAADGVTFSFDTSVVVDMRSPDQTGLPPCSLSRADHAQGTLDAASSPVTSFTGELSYTFSPTAGSQCADLTSGGAPVVAALPCAMSYALSGKHASP